MYKCVGRGAGRGGREEGAEGGEASGKSKSPMDKAAASTFMITEDLERAY